MHVRSNTTLGLVGRLRHLRYLRPIGVKKIRNMHHVRLPALEPRWLSGTTRRMK